ncbi:MAG: DNA alkylation repair protein [Bacteroidota bacterium]
MENSIITQIRRQLEQNSDEKIKIQGERFFREDVKMYGFKTVEVTRIGKNYFREIKFEPKEKIFSLCEELWQSGYMEEGFIACNWSRYLHKQYQPLDFNTFEKWVNNYITNWATCDTFCNHTVGTFIEMYPEYIKELKRWSLSGNRWVKRASAVSLIVPARKGKFLDDIFEIADILLLDQDDMVQKGYGWMLKVASQTYQKEVFDYVMSKKAVMPRTSLRYAIEKMPKDRRAKVMEK